MSEGTSANTGQQPVKYKRKLRNYLIDRRFQLKYTSMIMVLSLVLIVALGTLLYQQVLATVKENSRATDMSAEAARASADAAKVSAENSEIIIAQALADDYFKDEDITKKFIAEMKKPVEDVESQAAAMEQQARKMEKTREEFERRATLLPVYLGGFGLAFLLFLFLISVYTTHKIAGPMYKLKKLMSGVEGDSLHVVGSLRRGDEMWDLFDSFNSMIERLRAHQAEEIERVEALIDKLEKAGTDEQREEALSDLRDLKKGMQETLK
jgi:nitrate/nitrite-specific signal transduction histidine kinase